MAAFGLACSLRHVDGVLSLLRNYRSQFRMCMHRGHIRGRTPFYCFVATFSCDFKLPLSVPNVFKGVRAVVHNGCMLLSEVARAPLRGSCIEKHLSHRDVRTRNQRTRNPKEKKRTENKHESYHYQNEEHPNAVTGAAIYRQTLTTTVSAEKLYAARSTGCRSNSSSKEDSNTSIGGV